MLFEFKWCSFKSLSTDWLISIWVSIFLWYRIIHHNWMTSESVNDMSDIIRVCPIDADSNLCRFVSKFMFNVIFYRSVTSCNSHKFTGNGFVNGLFISQVITYHFQFMLWRFSIPLHPMKYPSIWNTFYNFCSLSACYPLKWHVYSLALQSAFFLVESCRECHFTWVMPSSCTQFPLAIRFSCLKLYCTAHWKLNSTATNVLLVFTYTYRFM